MPLTGSESALAAALGPEIKTQIQSVFQTETPFGDDVLEKFCTAVATAVANKIIPHIVANALTVTTVTGVQAGSSTLSNQQGTVT